MTDSVMIASIAASAVAPIVVAIVGYINNKAIVALRAVQEKQHEENTGEIGSDD